MLPNTIVKFNEKRFKLISCDMGGKCKIKKLDLPNKGSIISEVDISELTAI